MVLPADSHVHNEWSWDTGGPSSEAAGRMECSCDRAAAISLSAVIFTEHLDFTTRCAQAQRTSRPHQRHLLGEDGYLRPPALDVVGYLDCIDRCRHRFPELRILTGVEFGQPHLFAEHAARSLDLTAMDRVNGSLHTLHIEDDRSEPNTLFRVWAPDDVVRAYLQEIPRMVAGSDSFTVFSHIDYAVRAWPVADIGSFDPRRFEEGFRTAMRAIADSGRALEMNTRRLWP
ncbi:PHP domain-containing protein [Nocardia sp. NBC_01730]|uniref:PHP domain-containing protein n=1 Tax=Nocardia sp. NBC_01730 TaxID=2975998 RepID=UPI002E0E80E8